MPPRIDLAGWFTGSGRVARSVYFFTGICLFVLKFVIDWTIARIFGFEWTPLDYFVWPARQRMPLFELAGQEREFGLVMLAAAVPFIWIGVSMTLKRLRDAQLPLSFVLLFFIPIVNVLFILALCVTPSRPDMDTPQWAIQVLEQVQRMHRTLTGQRDSGAFAFALVWTVSFGVGLAFVTIWWMAYYGFVIFIAAPFLQGWLAAVLYGISRRRALHESVSIAMLALFVTALIFVLIAFEGVICLIMAAPIAIPLCWLGGTVGHACQATRKANESMPILIPGLIVTLPLLSAAEAMSEPKPTVHKLRTEVIVAAPIERVWQTVISFPPLPEPSELLFRAGIAYPIRAEMHGQGVGAVRHCVFSTGAFVEPIDVWDEPRCLSFRVTEQPEPMHELSPFDIHPPHLHNFLVSHRGQFQLESLPDGRTRLVGTTWYTNRMWPETYWAVWSDYIIHRVHYRVLEHVRDVAQRELK